MVAMWWRMRLANRVANLRERLARAAETLAEVAEMLGLIVFVVLLGVSLGLLVLP